MPASQLHYLQRRFSKSAHNRGKAKNSYDCKALLGILFVQFLQLPKTFTQKLPKTDICRQNYEIA